MWMLTGDKRETAFSIARSCGLCTEQTKEFLLDSTNEEETYRKIQEFQKKASELKRNDSEFSLVVESSVSLFYPFSIISTSNFYRKKFDFRILRIV